MKTFGFTGVGLQPLALAEATLLMIAVVGPATAQEMRVANVPAYARTDTVATGAFDYHTDEWAAIVFYRPPECVPGTFNLLEFYDVPGAFSCLPQTVSGFELWDNGPPTDAVPRQVLLSGLNVPVWFVSWSALEVAIADGVLTMSELLSLEPRMGFAQRFHEILHPADPGPSAAKVPHLTIDASGFIPSMGQSFHYQYNLAWNRLRPIVGIEFR